MKTQQMFAEKHIRLTRHPRSQGLFPTPYLSRMETRLPYICQLTPAGENLVNTATTNIHHGRKPPCSIKTFIFLYFRVPASKKDDCKTLDILFRAIFPAMHQNLIYTPNDTHIEKNRGLGGHFTISK